MRDLLVIGGGPAGLATAIFAAREGFQVALLEKGPLPRDKACGEGLMPAGVRLLEEMGTRPRRSHPFQGLRYVDGNRTAEAHFTSGTGLGIRRTELSSALTARALELGVELRPNTKAGDVELKPGGVLVRTPAGALRAQWLAVADGLRSPTRKVLGLSIPSRPRRRRRYGYRRHFRIRPWSSLVEVHWGAGAEAYVTPVGENEVGVALLWHESAPSYERMLARFPALEARLRSAPVVSELRGAGPFRQKAGRIALGRAALVGDAAGYLDALTGEGIALSFRSARALVSTLKRDAGLSRYQSAYRRLTRRYFLMTELVLLLAASPSLRLRVLETLEENPALFERLVAISHEHAPWSSLRWNGLFRLSRGILRPSAATRPQDSSKTS